jgi:hypothetical protein
MSDSRFKVAVAMRWLPRRYRARRNLGAKGRTPIVERHGQWWSISAELAVIAKVMTRPR